MRAHAFRVTAGLVILTVAACTSTDTPDPRSEASVFGSSIGRSASGAASTHLTCLPITIDSPRVVVVIRKPAVAPQMNVTVGDRITVQLPDGCAGVVSVQAHGATGHLRRVSELAWTVQEAGTTLLTFTAAMCQLIRPTPPGCAGGVASLGNLTVEATT